MMKKRAKIIIQAILGISLAASGLYIFIRQSGGGESILKTLIREISNTSAITVVVCVALTLLLLWLRAFRLGILLPDVEPSKRFSEISPSNAKEEPSVILENGSAIAGSHKRGLFAIIAVSFMVNNILPARLGEAARVVLLWKRNGFPMAVSVGSLLLERTLDIMAYLAFLFVSALLSPSINASLRSINPAAMTVVWGAAATFVALIGMFAFYAVAPHFFKNAALRLCAFLPVKIGAAAQKIGVEAALGLNWINSPRKCIGVTLASVAISCCYVPMFAVLVSDWKSFGILEGMFATAFAAFGAAIPLAPGYVGTQHIVLQQGLCISGLEPDKAAAVTVLYHALQYVLVTGLGLLFLALLNIKFRDITRSK